MAREKNPFGKTAGLETPYATFVRDDWEWRVLKTYQTPANEQKNQFGRWFVVAKSEFTFGSWEYGDTYIHNIFDVPSIRLIQATPEWLAAYPGKQLEVYEVMA
tara:strand:+ start:2518 stop:2826 length:309 start_codon:yes stop_codon:yes gene_type:complete